MRASMFLSPSRSAVWLIALAIAAGGCRDAQRTDPDDTTRPVAGEEVDETVLAACDHQLNEGDFPGGVDGSRRCLESLRWPVLPTQASAPDEAWTRGEGPVPGQPGTYGIIQGARSQFGRWNDRHFARGVPVARVIVTADVNQGGYAFRGARDGSWENVIWIRRTAAGAGEVFVQSYRRSGNQLTEVGMLRRMNVDLAYHDHADRDEPVPVSARWRYAPPAGSFIPDPAQQTGSLEHGGVIRLASNVLLDARFISGDGFWVRCGGGCCTGSSRTQ